MTRKRWIIGAVLVGLVASGGIATYFYLSAKRPEKVETPGEEWFEDVTEKVGVGFIHDAGDINAYLMPQINGSGVAVFDFDGDNRLDLYLLTHGGPNSQSTNRLYKNMPDGTFKDVTANSGLGIAGFNTGVIVGDINNDGRPDVVVGQVGGVKLFLNSGNGTFRDITTESGVKNPMWATSMSLFDYDRDGWLDLVIVNYVEYDPALLCPGTDNKREYCGPQMFLSTVTKLFRNRGGELAGKSDPKQPRAAFQDVTLQAGLAKAPGPGLGVICADFSGDGWPDILVANDLKPNHLWINQKNGTFIEEGFTRGIALDSMGAAQSGMGIAIGDVDGDGLFDIYVTHLTTEYNTLWVQGPKGQFRDQTARSNLLGTEWRGTGWGTVAADFDCDGWPDIALVNGRVTRGGGTPNPALTGHFRDYSERNQLLRNEGKGKFRDLSASNKVFCGTPNNARGLALGDLDGDGAPDMVVTTIAGRVQVLRNVVRNRGHWLSVQAFDPRLNRDAYGAEIRVKVGGRQFLRIVTPGHSFQSSSDPRASFGLGDATRYDEIHVLWPDGFAEVFPGGEVDRPRTLRRGEGEAEKK